MNTSLMKKERYMGKKNSYIFLLVHKEEIKFKIHSMSRGTVLESLAIFYLNLSVLHILNYNVIEIKIV